MARSLTVTVTSCVGKSLNSDLFSGIPFSRLYGLVSSAGITVAWDDKHYLLIWRSWDRASWYISIAKPTRCTIFEFIEYHSTFQINHQPHAPVFQFIILPFIYSSTYFGCSPAHHQELNHCSSSLWFYLRIVVIAGYHHDTNVKPEAATAVIELLMMGGRTPETCWAVNKRQGNKLENCCIWLVIYLNCTMYLQTLNSKSLYMFRTVFPSIIRSSRLYTQH